MTAKKFLEEVYVPSKPAAVRALFAGIDDIPGNPLSLAYRMRRAKELSDAGEVIDEIIDAEGLVDAFDAMKRRLFYGFKNWPSMAQGTNVDSFGVRIDNPNYAIKVSIDPKDYPKNSEPDIPQTLYVGARMNRDGQYNTQNSPEKAINPDTNELYKRGDTVREQKNIFTLEGPAVDGSYLWQIQP